MSVPVEVVRMCPVTPGRNIGDADPGIDADETGPGLSSGHARFPGIIRPGIAHRGIVYPGSGGCLSLCEWSNLLLGVVGVVPFGKGHTGEEMRTGLGGSSL